MYWCNGLAVLYFFVGFEFRSSSLLLKSISIYPPFAYTIRLQTHTMEGDLKSQENKGIIPRAVDALFEGVTEADENMEFTFKVSYVEIYLEKIRDLLDENRLKVNLTIREDKIKGIYIAGVTEEYVTSPQETLNVMNAGTLFSPVSFIFVCFFCILLFA